jgi:hypothetical protein
MAESYREVGLFPQKLLDPMKGDVHELSSKRGVVHWMCGIGDQLIAETVKLMSTPVRYRIGPCRSGSC